MSNMYNSYQENAISSAIDPYYMKGDVFQRDQRYYDQVYSTRRSRTPNKGDTSIIGRPTQSVQPSQPLQPSQPSYPVPTGSTYNQPTGSQVLPNSGVYNNTNTAVSNVNQQDPEQLRRLREENLALSNELQQLTYGGQFGTGDAVVKMGHYTASKQQNATIRDQQLKIKQLQDTIRLNNQKLIKYQKASNELEIRMNNIQSIDKQIYRQLKTASTRDKELLQRASAALSRGESKEGVMRILQQIAFN